MECDRSCETICVLKRVMAVIPGSAILRDIELICIAIAGRNSALCDRIDTIMLESIEHTNTVPMDGRAVVFQMIFNGDFDRVTPAGFNPRPGVLLVEGFAAVGSSDPIGIDVVVGNIEVIL